MSCLCSHSYTPAPITDISLLVFSAGHNPTNPSRSSPKPIWGVDLLASCIASSHSAGHTELPSQKALSQIFAGCCEMKVGWTDFSSQGKFRIKMKANNPPVCFRMNDKLTTDGTGFYTSSLIPLKLYGEASRACSIWGIWIKSSFEFKKYDSERCDQLEAVN